MGEINDSNNKTRGQIKDREVSNENSQNERKVRKFKIQHENTSQFRNK